MKKSVNVDISNLFRKFGGDTGNYKEIQQDYFGEKAQKQWPIIQAVENERAVAPRLKMDGEKNLGAAATQPGSHLGKHVEHHPAGVKAVANSAGSALFSHSNGMQSVSAAPVQSLFRDLNDMRTKSVEAPAPAHSLFDALRPVPTDAPEATPGPARSLFGGLAAKPVEAQSSHNESVQVRSSENDALGKVFSRLLNSHEPEAVSAPDQNLRSMLGFLTKQ